VVVLEGDIEEVGADALIRLIAGSRRSGRLELRRAAGRGELTFSVGDVCGAYSSFAGDPLGLRLVESGVVTRRRVRAALDEHVDLGRRLGQVLIESGDIDSELLSEALREQMLDRILEILDWETGTFKWTPADEVRLDEAVAITAQEVFDERLRRNASAEVVSRVMAGGSGQEDRNSDERLESAGLPGRERHAALSLTSETSDGIFDVVIVCTGNQFRSPIVEGLMKASSSPLPLRVSSVGTKELGAPPALPEAIRLASEFGVDLTAHRARSLRGIDLSGADLVIGFELEHVAAAVVEAGATYERTFTILELVSLLEEIPPPDDDDPVRRARAAIDSAHRLRPEGASLSPDAQIRDPVGGRGSVYRETADHLRSATRHLIDRLFGFVPYSPPLPTDRGKFRPAP
jgi:protein-tyrosine phosphatase